MSTIAYISANGNPDEYSEGSGNLDQDWDGGNNDNEDDTSKGVSQVKGGIRPGSANTNLHRQILTSKRN
jgi:hypothetical protein